MYDILKAKVDRWSRKIYFLKKKAKIMDNFLDMLTLEGAGSQTDDTGSTFRVPLKTLGYTGSNYLCGRSVASKLSVQEPDTFGQGNQSKTLYSSARYSETKRDIGMAQKRSNDVDA